MLCPSCGYLLQKLSVTTTSGGKFDVEHCGRCGGTWFDSYEINRIPFHEVTRLAHITVLPKTHSNVMLNSFQHPGEIPKQVRDDKMYCPRCRKILIQSQYESMPRGLHMLRCPGCGGIWATQKALEEFKIQEEKTVAEYKKSGLAFPSLSVVFIPALFMLLFLFSTFITITKLEESREARIKAADEISQMQIVSIGSTNAAITFQTQTPLVSSLSYGTSSLEFTVKVISATPAVSHKILLTNLHPDTIYYFRITLTDELGRVINSDLKSFRTGK